MRRKKFNIDLEKSSTYDGWLPCQWGNILDSIIYSIWFLFSRLLGHTHTFIALLIDCQLMLEHNRTSRTQFRDDLSIAIFPCCEIIVYVIQCLHILFCPLLMQSHHKIIRIYDDVVQNPSLPGAFPNFWMAV